MDRTKVETALAESMGAFEIVFRYDWDHTRTMIGDQAEGATFVEPGLDDESEDWGARGALLEKYRALVVAMKEVGIEPNFPFSLTNLPGFKGRAW